MSSAARSNLPAALRGPIDCLMIDNFDSFTWNLYQSLELLGTKVTVIRNDAISPKYFPLLKLNSLIVSPGPGHPRTDSGISRDAIKYFTGEVPVLGVCMGLECLVDVFGGEIGYAGEIKHGKLSAVKHDGRGCFVGVPQGFQSTRYHSLSTEVTSLPDELAITATTQDSGVVMGVRHRKYTLEAVQYHPESILSEEGDSVLRNFLKLRGGLWEENPDANVHVSLPPFPIEVPEGDEKAKANAAKLPTILEKIYAQRREDVEAAKKTPGTTPADLDTFLAMNLAPPLISFVSRLRSAASVTTTGSPAPALLAEIKRASPSKGPIALNANVAQQAQTYALSGAAVISVLTEPHWFKGSLTDMRLARQAVDVLPNRPAILRKEFILDEYQIAEARLYGADTILLIVAMLPVTRLHALYAYAVSLGMEPLVEVNSAAEMTAALELGAKVIGVNNRNLHSFEVDMGTTSRLADMVKGKDVILLALSGISSPEDVRGYVQEGVGGVLVGEALMRAPDVAVFIRELLDQPPPVVPEFVHEAPLVKICGIRTPEEAQGAADAGADLLGLMFVPSSKRHIDLATAQTISALVRGKPAPPEDGATSPSDDYATALWFSGHAKRLRASARTAGRPLLVGVFQHQPLAEILHAVAATPLDLVQLHGSEPTEWARAIPVPVIRVFHVSSSAAGAGVKGITAPGPHEFVLLDAMREDGLSGGSGKVVDWDVASAVVQAGEVYSKEGVSSVVEPMPIILAGGLTPENVGEAVGKVRPWAVDVSGGVEVEGGAGKDLDKVKAFVAAAKGLSTAAAPTPAASA